MSKLCLGLASAAFFVMLGTTPVLAFDVPTATEEPEAAESAGDPATEAKIGDDLDLFAVLDTFKASETVEDFERRLNDPDAAIVNIDLNGDDEVDFLGVFEEGDGEVRVVILRAFMAENESQDVASIELERRGEDVTVQVVGNPALYGPDYIVEPDLSEEASLSTRLVVRPLHVSELAPVLVASADARWWPAFEPAEDEGAFDLAAVVVVRTWPAVYVMYGPGYTYYRSTYVWRSYPSYYRARRPVARSHYRHHTAHHRDRYRRTNHRSSTRASNVYRNNATSSQRVQARSSATTARPAATPSPSPSTTQSRPQNSGNEPSARPSGGGNRRSGGSPGRRR